MLRASADVSCIDVNECQDLPGTCQQLCRNTWGSFYCACHDGYQLQPDSVSCTGGLLTHQLLCITQVHKKLSHVTSAFNAMISALAFPSGRSASAIGSSAEDLFNTDPLPECHHALAYLEI